MVRKKDEKTILSASTSVALKTRSRHKLSDCELGISEFIVGFGRCLR